MGLMDKIALIDTQIKAMKVNLGLPESAPLDTVVTTTETGGGSVAPVKSNVYRVSTLAEMYAIDNMIEGDMCVVIRGGLANMTVSDTTSTLTFPSVVTLPEAFTESGWLSLNDTNRTVDVMIMLESTMFRADVMSNSGYISIAYESSDGITYTRTDSEAETIDLGVEVSSAYPEEWKDQFGYFLQVDGTVFDGLFTYGDGWDYSNIAVGVKPEHVLKKKTVYTNNGHITGNIFETVDNNTIGLIEDYAAQINALSSTVTDFTLMYGKKSQTSFMTLPYLNTSSAEDMSYMFQSFKGTSLDLSHFDFTNVKNLKGFLNGVSNLTSITFPTGTNLTPNLEDLNGFLASSDLEEVDLSWMDTSKVKNFSNLFYWNESLKRVNISSWTVTSAESLSYMFEGNKSLQHIDMRNIEFSKCSAGFGGSVTNGVPLACEIIVKNDTERQYILTKTGRNYTNIKTVAEYGG